MRVPHSWTIVCASVLLVAGCSSDAGKDQMTACDFVMPTSCPKEKPSFKHDVFPVLDAKCNTCHKVNSKHWPFDNYEDVSHWSSQIESDLATCAMPPEDAGETLSAKERETIIAWTLCGSPNN